MPLLTHKIDSRTREDPCGLGWAWDAGRESIPEGLGVALGGGLGDEGGPKTHMARQKSMQPTHLGGYWVRMVVGNVCGPV